ncbi:MAG TPA: DUF5694 domain-containing protein [Niabella sp.]|nr:DUF5694 domain-containing protein [Niabella sp.]HOZ96719.1 DUF5694 domain-containing protein [Niabella sp.]HQW14413.1 DUF5694 domain-containing protein [Niabella sp.]HQX19828.1 DUF5694 domain-containing protein [Niabella sp.]HRB07761.1 DUF5694 domain-containing protein [Niabella sp.]
MKSYLSALLLVLSTVSFGQKQTTKVLTLGSFHFAFYNRDVKKIDIKDQINILDKKYQDEIKDIVNRIAKFKPTIIVIEQDPESQDKIDSLYNLYLTNSYNLRREEYEQLGFRLAKMFNLKKLFCVNDWGRNYKNIDSLLDNDPKELNKFIDFFYKNPDTTKQFFVKDVFKTQGILQQLRLLNEKKNIEKDLGNYLIAVFKYQTKGDEYFGADYTTGYWFNRNLRIFRNIQKIGAKPNDRILVIFGAGHMSLLNIFFGVSPDFDLQNTNEYLK